MESAAYQAPPSYSSDEEPVTTKFIDLMATESCPEPDVCLTLGIFADEIKEQFGNFTDFEKVKSIKPPLKTTDNEDIGLNAVIQKITYTDNNNKNAYAILKKAQTAMRDNIMYEYIVGQYINKLNKLYPCFIETYGLYKNNNSNKITTKEELLNLQPITEINLNEICSEPEKFYILIQNIQAKTFHDVFYNTELGKKNVPFIDKIKNEIMWILFQIYIPLAQVKDTFTHYDLHKENILLYEVEEGKYIQYHYHFADGQVITFKSKYMAKIIDYGSSYFNDTEAIIDNNNSAIIKDQICANNEKCTSTTSPADFEKYENVHNELFDKKIDNSCGWDNGFLTLHALKGLNGKNESQDLFLLFSFWIPFSENDDRKLEELEKAQKNKILKPIINFFNKVNYAEKWRNKKNLPGNDLPTWTEEIIKSGLPKKINNVQDAADTIKEYVKMNNKQHDTYYQTEKVVEKFGDLHVNMDGLTPMKFIPNILRKTTENTPTKSAKLSEYPGEYDGGRRRRRKHRSTKKNKSKHKKRTRTRRTHKRRH